MRVVDLAVELGTNVDQIPRDIEGIDAVTKCHGLVYGRFVNRPYRFEVGLIYIYPDHRIYGITCTHKIRFVSVGDDVFAVRRSTEG